MNVTCQPNRTWLPGIVLAACMFLLPDSARAQTGSRDGPLPPPVTPPESRLVVTPSEFEHWMAGTTPEDEAVAEQEPEADEPSLVTAPPPPPTLTAPPPPEPKLVTPPPPPRLAPAPKPAPPAPSAEPEEPTPEGSAAEETGPPAAAPVAPESRSAPLPPPAAPKVTQPAAPPAESPGTPLTPPPAPRMEEPPAPEVATLPPDSPVTKPSPPLSEPLEKPEAITILYAEDAMDIPETGKGDLNRAAAWMRENPSARMQIVGYASDTSGMESQARRTSLYRTLAVRKYLVDNGILSTRMNLCAMGAKAKESPRDRVELYLKLDSPLLDCQEFVK